jgi:hypothetical protein
LEVHLIDDLSNDSMEEAMAASWTIVEGGFLERLWSRKYFFHHDYPNLF